MYQEEEFVENVFIDNSVIVSQSNVFNYNGRMVELVVNSTITRTGHGWSNSRKPSKLEPRTQGKSVVLDKLPFVFLCVPVIIPPHNGNGSAEIRASFDSKLSNGRLLVRTCGMCNTMNSFRTVL